MSSTLEEAGEVSPGIQLSQRDSSELSAFRKPEQSWEEEPEEWDGELVPMESLKEKRGASNREEKEKTRQAVSQLLDEIQEEIRIEHEQELSREDFGGGALHLSRPWEDEEQEKAYRMRETILTRETR